jgi:hypothetical protein
MLSALLHWLVSQSFFLVSVQFFIHDDDTQEWTLPPGNSGTRISCGSSLLPLLVLLITGGILLVAIFARGLMPMRSAAPVVGSCSAAIAAAC